MSNDKRLDLGAIKARVVAATPGEWGWNVSQQAVGDDVWVYRVDPALTDPETGENSSGDGSHIEGRTICQLAREVQRKCFTAFPRAHANADLIANAPDDIASLVAEVERLRASLTEIRDRCDPHVPPRVILTSLPVAIDVYRLADDALRGTSGRKE